MVKKKITSPSGSMNGWNWLKWLKGNWKTIKEIIKLGVPLILGMKFFINNPALIAVITALGKLALDSLEYLVKEY